MCHKLFVWKRLQFTLCCGEKEIGMLDQYSRFQLLVGREGIERLHGCHVAVFGIGGVGGYAVEALARSGVGELTLVDDDKVCLTNLNRQLFALRSTIGRHKVEVARDRVLDINPKCIVHMRQTFYLPETSDEFDFSEYDYVIDAVDTVTAKLSIIERAINVGTPIISCMGAGNKMDPSKLEVADIYDTSICPLARVMRHECKKRGIAKLKVVYSKEKAMRHVDEDEVSCKNHCVCPPGTARKCTARRDIPGSSAFVPPAAGLLIASEVVRELLIMNIEAHEEIV